MNVPDAPRAAVVVPVYRSALDADERISFVQCVAVLARHPLVVVAPHGLDLGAHLALAENHGVSLRVERFAVRYFGSLTTYNALLMAAEFYRRFAEFDYILLHQLDAFVFADRLAEFCALGYDYIGAPWLHEPPLRRTVGNGGFSLRRVAAALRVLTGGVPRLPSSWLLAYAHHRPQGGRITRWLYRAPRCRAQRLMQGDRYLPPSLSQLLYLNEDGFWGQNCDKLAWYGTAPVDVALRFAFETEPRTALARNGGVLPFGCHGWARLDAEFWRPHVERCRHRPA